MDGLYIFDIVYCKERYIGALSRTTSSPSIRWGSKGCTLSALLVGPDAAGTLRPVMPNCLWVDRAEIRITSMSYYVDACLMYGCRWNRFWSDSKGSSLVIKADQRQIWAWIGNCIGMTWSSNDAVSWRQRCQCCRGAISRGLNAFLIPCFQWHSSDIPVTLGQCPYFVAAWLCFPRLIAHAGVARTDASQAAKAGQERQRPMLDPTILSFSQLNGVFAFLSMYIIIVYIYIILYIHIIIIYI